ncbi:KAT8 regulatory NSL complex subunit 3 [Bienertia sinuspersici]
MADSLRSSKRRRTSHSETQNDAVETTNTKNLSPLVVFAHGAGAPSTSDWMIRCCEKAVAKHPDHPLILAGKSMGSRVSCMVASRDDISASAIVCLGYPLKGMNGAIRDEILVQLTIPIMFVQGSKDGLCPLDKLKAVRKKIKPNNDLHVIEGGDHSFKLLKAFASK